MKSIIKKKAYPLDSSAIYHLGSMSKKYMNTFRITVKLKEKVQPAMLQEALRNITPRYIGSARREKLSKDSDIPLDASRVKA